MKHKFRFKRDDAELVLISLPTVIWYVLFTYLPMFGIIIAFKKFKPLPKTSFITSLIKSDFVGIDNFKFLFATPDAWVMMRNTLAYNAAFIVLGIVVPVTLAIMISQLYSQKLAKTCQTAMFLPHFLSWVVVSYFLFAFLSSDKGLVNKTLQSMGKDPVTWYAEAQYWPYFLIMLNMWKSVGYGMVIYLAGISGIDHSLYEAAIIDGATKFQQIKNITIPMLKPVMIIMFILSVGHIFSTDFGLFYNIPRNSGAIVNATQTVDVYVYKALMSMNNIGFSSSAAFLQSILGFITITSANWIVSKIDPESSLF